jgi:hypothetical protein
MNIYIEKLFDAVFYILMFTIALFYFMFLSEAIIKYNHKVNLIEKDIDMVKNF